MQRNLKLQQKRLKREKKKAKDAIKLSSPNLYWPTIFCTGEMIFIGLSYNFIRKKHLAHVRSVHEDDWKSGICDYRDPKYRIDFSKFKKDDEVICPNCGKPVDFRMWISATRPKFVEIMRHDKKDYTDKLPDTQASGN